MMMVVVVVMLIGPSTESELTYVKRLDHAWNTVDTYIKIRFLIKIHFTLLKS